MRFVFLVLAAIPVLAQPSTAPPPAPVVRTTGEGTVMVKPDQARIDIGVVAQAPNAAKAAADTAAQADAVIRAIRDAAGPGAEVRTISYSVQPDYSQPRPTGRPTITGYTASNIVQVTTPDLDRVGKIIDAAMGAGANNVRQLQFTLKDPQAPKQLALKEAALHARASAQSLASALGLRIVRILAVEETGGGPIRPMMEFSMNGPVVPTPVEAGTIEVRATVSLAAEVTQ